MDESDTHVAQKTGVKGLKIYHVNVLVQIRYKTYLANVDNEHKF